MIDRAINQKECASVSYCQIAREVESGVKVPDGGRFVKLARWLKAMRSRIALQRMRI